MKCNCIAKIIKLVKKENGISAKDDFECNGIGFRFVDGKQASWTSFKWRKQGAHKWEKMNMFHTYCPFCGKRKIKK